MREFIVTRQNGIMLEKIKEFDDYQKAIAWVRKHIKPKAQKNYSVMDYAGWLNIDPRYRDSNVSW